MNKNEILEKIKKGEYRIEADGSCDCAIDISADGKLDFTGNECWKSNKLWVGKEIIAEYVQFEGFKFFVEEIEEEIPTHILDDMRIRDTEPQHDLELIFNNYLETLENTKYYADDEAQSIYFVNEKSNPNFKNEDWKEVSTKDIYNFYKSSYRFFKI